MAEIEERRIFEELTEKIDIADSQYTGPERFRVTRTGDLVNRAAIEKAVLHFIDNAC